MTRLILLATVLTASLHAQAPTAGKYKLGHSHLGEDFDIGPRQKPWLMPNIGKVHFPITHQNPEVQQWFDQGITLLHSFWEYEAERSFRWALKLEPENAMAWWGLSKATSGQRSTGFLREASKRKQSVTERERLYIEAAEALTNHESLRDRGDSYESRERDYVKVLESISLKYPEDLEAKALLALAGIGKARYANELIVREILAKQPDHPGAHHYRIHNWNYHEPEQALASCKRYGEIAPGSGHALHMPGHVYATAGLWHEAAISMDAATRAEKRYMLDRLTFPFNNWNYGHNRAYLSYIQEQLGLPDAAVFGARQLIDAPLDPEGNSDSTYSSHSQGLRSMMRVLIKFERWDDLLKPSVLPWRETPHDRMWKAYTETRVPLARKDSIAAEKAFSAHQKLKADLDKNNELKSLFELQTLELKARFALDRNDTLAGLSLLSEAASKQYDLQTGDNDPPNYPEVLYNVLGNAYLAASSPHLARQSFETALKLTRNDIWSLSGLVRAHHALNDGKAARPYLERLLYTASGASKDLALLRDALATGIQASPRDNSPMPQRKYSDTDLSKYGPNVWEPFPAPKLDVLDPESKPVTLSDYKGKNVILVYYLGRECLHCMKQLQDLQAKKAEWERLDTVILAVSGNLPEANAKALAGMKLPGVRILSDRNHENARRFRSYDDFEEMELHSTILIDRKGRVHWARTGGEPFSKLDFLVKQLERMNASLTSD